MGRGNKDPVIRFPDGETVSRLQVMNVYLREKRNHIVRLRTRPWPFSRQCVFFRCHNCRGMFQPYPGDDAVFGTDVYGAESPDPCPYCGERWIYNDFDHWVRAWVTEMEDDDRRYAERQKRADERLRKGDRAPDV